MNSAKPRDELAHRLCRNVPRSTSDVVAAMAIARELHVPLLSRGAGSSQCGQTTGAALVSDHSKYLRKMLSVDVAKMRTEVEPGLVLDHLSAQLNPHGLWFPVDVSTSAQATLGGMAGNNSCGSRSIAQGNMAHNVAGIEAWLAEGNAPRGWLQPRHLPSAKRTALHGRRRGESGASAGRQRRHRLAPPHPRRRAARGATCRSRARSAPGLRA